MPEWQDGFKPPYTPLSSPLLLYLANSSLVTYLHGQPYFFVSKLVNFGLEKVQTPQWTACST